MASFTDVELTAWYAPYILAAKTNNIIDGYEDGGFSPNGLINRAEALKILLVAAGFDVAEKIEAVFPDVPVSAWFAKYVTYAYNNGIVGGYANGKFGPGNNITRAEVAKIVTKILDMK